MSKSLNNFITIRELLEKYEAMPVRLFVLQAHYRKPLDFTDEALDAATNGWQTLKDGLLFGDHYGEKLGFEQFNSDSISVSKKQEICDRFQESIDDDFNFAGGLAVIFELAKELKKEGNLLTHQGKTDKDSLSLYQDWLILKELTQVLGLDAKIEVENNQLTLTDEEIETLIQQRIEARKNKNYAEGDRIRNELQAQGIILLDKQGGITTWHRG